MTESKQLYMIRYWFEWGGFCFWGMDERTKERFGNPIEPEDLPLSSATIVQVDELTSWHEQSLNWDYPPDPGPWRQDECDRFNAAAKELLETCRRELANDFELIDAYKNINEDPDLDAYLQNPVEFKRSEA